MCPSRHACQVANCYARAGAWELHALARNSNISESPLFAPPFSLSLSLIWRLITKHESHYLKVERSLSLRDRLKLCFSLFLPPPLSLARAPAEQSGHLHDKRELIQVLPGKGVQFCSRSRSVRGKSLQQGREERSEAAPL